MGQEGVHKPRHAEHGLRLTCLLPLERGELFRRELVGFRPIRLPAECEPPITGRVQTGFRTTPHKNNYALCHENRHKKFPFLWDPRFDSL